MLMNTGKLLERLEEFVTKANKTNKSTEKAKILSSYKDLKEILRYVYDRSITFGITSKSYKKYVQAEPPKSVDAPLDFLKLLDSFAQRRITGHDALEKLRSFIRQYPNHESTILNVIDKNLKIRMNTKQINRVIPGLIKDFRVALAEKYQKKWIDKSFRYFVSRKLDGVRCICKVVAHQNGPISKILFFSRIGNEFLDKNKRSTLTTLETHIQRSFGNLTQTVYLDGELCVVDSEGREDFTEIMKEIRIHVKNPRYYVFDILSEREFETGTSASTYSERYRRLERLYLKNDHVVLLQQYPLEHLSALMKKMEKHHWEGLMIRKDTVYKAGRSKDLLKLKKFQEGEFRVLGITKGPFRVVGADGLEKEIMTMTSAVIDYNNTKVGSGFSLEERKLFFKHPERIIGKKITVKFFERTKDSLRFPIFKGVRDYE